MPESDAPPGDAQATWLSSSLLLAVSASELPAGDTTATISAGDTSVDAAVRSISVVSGNGAGELKVVTAAVREDVPAARLAERLTLGAGEGKKGAASVKLTDLTGIVEGPLSGLR